MRLPNDIVTRHTEAVRLLGKSDGISALLPDRDWFLMMFIRKDASNSSRIEGTNATMMDAIERQNVEPRADLPEDVDDILHYIGALDYGIRRMRDFPFSLGICGRFNRLGRPLPKARRRYCKTFTVCLSSE
jgi:hypothetical protein